VTDRTATRPNRPSCDRRLETKEHDMAHEMSRKQFFKVGAGGVLGLYMGTHLGGSTPVAQAAIPGGNLDPVTLSRFVTPLLIPPVMPRAGAIKRKRGV
jgi:hypothetical protein